MMAVGNGYADITQLFINASADVNLIDNDGRTSLMLCSALNSVEICEMLMDAGADPHVVNAYGKNAIDVALSGNRDLVANFIEAKIECMQVIADTAICNEESITSIRPNLKPL